MKLFKITQDDGKTIFAPGFVYDLPKQNEQGEWIPGAWATAQGTLRFGLNGLHLVTDPWHMLDDWEIFERFPVRVWYAEHDGDYLDYGLTRVASRARLLAPADDIFPDWWQRVPSILNEIKASLLAFPNKRDKRDWHVLVYTSFLNAAQWLMFCDFAPVRVIAEIADDPDQRRRSPIIAVMRMAELLANRIFNHTIDPTFADMGILGHIARSARLTTQAYAACRILERDDPEVMEAWDVWTKGLVYIGHLRQRLLPPNDCPRDDSVKVLAYPFPYARKDTEVDDAADASDVG